MSPTRWALGPAFPSSEGWRAQRRSENTGLSTLQDLEAGKPLELAAIIDAVVELADLPRWRHPPARHRCGQRSARTDARPDLTRGFRPRLLTQVSGAGAPRRHDRRRGFRSNVAEAEQELRPLADPRVALPRIRADQILAVQPWRRHALSELAKLRWRDRARLPRAQHALGLDHF